MQIVIDIPKEYYEILKEMSDETLSMDMAIIKYGTPLPEHHGRIIDEKDLSLMTVHLIDGMLVCDAPTIIEGSESE